MAKNVDELVKKAQEIAPFAENETFGTIALTEGDTLTITGETTTVKSTTPGVPDWAAVTTEEGYNIGYRQFTRRGNGLKYPAEVTTPAQAIAALIKKAAELENGLTLRLKEVRKVESSTRKGKNTYYIFEDTEI